MSRTLKILDIRLITENFYLYAILGDKDNTDIPQDKPFYILILLVSGLFYKCY